MQIITKNIKSFAEKIRNENNKIVFTNGCFDILHAGHVIYLQKAKKLGDILILGLNSDSSIKKLKGENRPINNESDRALILSALRYVDHIVVFDEDTPYNLIKLIQPDILVKGGDYKPEQVVGKEIVEQRGGRVEIIQFLDGRSTSKIIEKLDKTALTNKK